MAELDDLLREVGIDPSGNLKPPLATLPAGSEAARKRRQEKTIKARAEREKRRLLRMGQIDDNGAGEPVLVDGDLRLEGKDQPSKAGPIVRDVVYFADILYEWTGIGENTYKKMRKDGLKVRRVGCRKAIYGGDLIDFIRDLPTDDPQGD